MTTPFPFQAAAVLTAAQMNAITTLVTSTKTASHTLTIADVSTRVIMNSASATTITVNTSIFGASDVVEILNIGAGVCTVTAGTCTVGTSGTLALAQNAGGTLTFISASASVFRATGVTAAAGGFVRVGGGSVGASSSIQFTSVFSSTYNSYRIVGQALTNTSSNHVTFVLDGITTGYYAQRVSVAAGGTAWTVAASATNAANSGNGIYLGTATSDVCSFQMDISSPNLATPKAYAIQVQSLASANGQWEINYGRNASVTQATGITFTNVTGNFASGRIDIYGYALS